MGSVRCLSQQHLHSADHVCSLPQGLEASALTINIVQGNPFNAKRWPREAPLKEPAAHPVDVLGDMLNDLQHDVESDMKSDLQAVEIPTFTVHPIRAAPSRTTASL